MRPSEQMAVRAALLVLADEHHELFIASGCDPHFDADGPAAEMRRALDGLRPLVAGWDAVGNCASCKGSGREMRDYGHGNVSDEPCSMCSTPMSARRVILHSANRSTTATQMKKADLRGYVNSLCEPGASRAYGAWADGHVDKTDFMCAVHADFERFVSLSDIAHGYYRVVRGIMHFTSRKGRGATPVTWTEW